jgi:hypothetical protein
MRSLGVHNAAFIASRILACDTTFIIMSGETLLTSKALAPSAYPAAIPKEDDVGF